MENADIGTEPANANKFRVREAGAKDKPAWDSFTTEYGRFQDYFDWKTINEAAARHVHHDLLMAESDQSGLAATAVIHREERAFHSFVQVNGFRFKPELTKEERRQCVRAFIEYLEQKHARRLSTFKIIEDVNPLVPEEECYYPDLAAKGFKPSHPGGLPDLPCKHVMPLKAPFEENIWKGLWAHKTRQEINKVERSGVTVVQDPEFRHLEDYIAMLNANYRRHEAKPPARESTVAEFELFKDKTRMFVTLKDGRPVAIMSGRYTPSTCYLWEIGSFSRNVEDANKLCYKVVIKDACDRGYQYVHFGNSFVSGLAEFKERFGGQRIRLRKFEKRYSAPRLLASYAPAFFASLGNPRALLTKFRRTVFARLVRPKG